MSVKDETASFARARTKAIWQEEFSERAAIHEYLGEIPRKEAEQMARKALGPCPRK